MIVHIRYSYAFVTTFIAIGRLSTWGGCLWGGVQAFQQGFRLNSTCSLIPYLVPLFWLPGFGSGFYCQKVGWPQTGVLYEPGGIPAVVSSPGLLHLFWSSVLFSMITKREFPPKNLRPQYRPQILTRAPGAPNSRAEGHPQQQPAIYGNSNIILIRTTS